MADKSGESRSLDYSKSPFYPFDDASKTFQKEENL